MYTRVYNCVCWHEYVSKALILLTDDDTRVLLEASDNTSGDYINASYITVRDILVDQYKVTHYTQGVTALLKHT